jgi:hypothetical protein
LAYSDQFCMLLVSQFRSRCDPIVSGTPGSGYGQLIKTRSFGQFCMLLLTDLGSRCDPNVPGTPMSGYGELVKTRSFGLLLRGLYAISH